MGENGKELFIKEEIENNLIKGLAENIGESLNNLETLPEESGEDSQNQLTEEEKKILKLFNGFFNFEAQNSEAKSSAQYMELNNPYYFNEKYTYSEDIPNTQSQSQNDTKNSPITIIQEKKLLEIEGSRNLLQIVRRIILYPLISSVFA
ncbi:hypothetical protein O181_035467 [Austropuccinia psidii MF-1]|uniref:Uncharacterized protein n=1 Tax=Austropuccinia psidii MF-1 TaxID=1389203 RepID=A0A9Q3D8P4_9BASI|nr:hypothetical protein [Austropuccinia psidii MF-1]